MSEPLIRAALETRLATMSPGLDTALENGAYTVASGGVQTGLTYTPVTGRPYQRVNLLRATPENPEMGTGQQALGIFQVTLFYPENAGPGTAEARAKLIADHFPRALSLTASGVVVTITRSAYIMAGFVDGDRWAVPVRIPYHANLFS